MQHFEQPRGTSGYIGGTSAQLPSTLRFVITGRLDVDMRLAFKLRPHFKILELDSTTSKNDMLTFF